MVKKNRLVTVRVPEWVARDADELAEYERRPRSQILREVIEKGLRQRKLDDAMDQYSKGEISIGRAAEIAGITIGEAIDERALRKIPMHYDMEDLEEDIAAAREWAKEIRKRRR